MSPEGKRKIEIRFMGPLDCRCGGKRLDFVYNTGAKTSQMLLMLLLSAHKGVPREQVREALYHDSEADAANSLKTLFSRLRESFNAALGLRGAEGLTLRGGIYDIAEGIEVVSDTGRFRSLCECAGAEQDERASARLLAEACEAYGGELLPPLSTELWVIYENAALGELYSDAVRRLGAYYERTMDYESAYACYKRALGFFPFTEEWILGSINALLSQGRYNQALNEYEEVSETLFDELGVYPSEQLLDALRRISDKLSFPITTAENVSRSLAEDKPRGAYYCTYPNFLSSYRILRRVMDRDEMPATLVLFTVVDEQGKPLEGKSEVAAAVTALHIALGKTLRRSDMYTRFSKAQMLVLLWNMSPAHALPVIERVRGRLNEEESSARCRFEAAVLEGDEPPVSLERERAVKRKTWKPMP